MWPSTIAVQMCQASRPTVAFRTAQMPSGTTICDTIEMYSGLRVSPVPCSAPVKHSATVTNRPDTARYRSSC